jgi:hypothetical protein
LVFFVQLHIILNWRLSAQRCGPITSSGLFYNGESPSCVGLMALHGLVQHKRTAISTELRADLASSARVIGAAAAEQALSGAEARRSTVTTAGL